MARKKQQACPCGSQKTYSDCCGRFIEHGELPQTAEELMRSRYTAYAARDRDYLLKTWHPSTRPQQLTLYEDAPVKWVKLSILKTQSGLANDNNGTVEFVARFKVNGKAELMQENSHFRKENGQWFYVSGDLN